jgi:hypothetical protein
MSEDMTTASKTLAFQEVLVQDYYETGDDCDDDDVDTAVGRMTISKLDDSR